MKYFCNYLILVFLLFSCTNKQTQEEIKDISADDYYNQGLSDFYNENYENALVNYEKAISIDSTIPAYYINRGVIKDIKRDTIEAIKDYKKAIQLDSLSYIAYHNIGVLAGNAGMDSLALFYFLKCKEIAPTYYLVYHSLAITYFDLKKYKSALENLNMSILHNFDLRNSDLYYAGLIAKETGRTEQAKEYFKEAAALGNKDAEQELLKY